MALNQILQPFADGLAQQSLTDDQQKATIASQASALTAAQNQVTVLQNTITTLQLDDSTAQAMVVSLRAQLAAARPAKTWRNLERNPFLIAGGTAANTGSIGSSAAISITPPTQTCPIATITPAGPFADKYAYQPLGADDSLVRFQQFGSILFPAASDAANSQAFEFDLPQSLSNGLWCNWGVQYDFADGLLRVWNKSTGAWVSTGVPLKRFPAAKWVDHSFDFHRDAANNVIVDGLQLNGVQQITAPIMFPPVLLNKPPLLNHAFQEDGNGTKPIGAAFSVALNDFGLLAWTA